MQQECNWEEDLVPLEELDLSDPDEEEEELPRFGWVDILAMTIAAYQIIFPIVLVLFSVVFLLYLVLRFLAR